MSKKNHENRKLDKQLIAYSLAAGTVFLGAVNAEANIHHTDLGSGIELYTDGAALDIDFDGGGPEFRIFFGTSSNRVNVDYRSDNASWRGGNGWGTGGTLLAGAVALDVGDNVYVPGAQWGHESSHEHSSTYGNMASNMANSDGGSFLNTSGKYLGVKFMIGANTNYGWIQVDVSGTTFPTNAVIKGYAYEDTPNGQIVTGAVPEAGSLALLALGAAGLAAWRKK